MPDKLVDVMYVLLMWFRSKKSLEEPTSIMDLPYVAYVEKTLIPLILSNDIGLLDN